MALDAADFRPCAGCSVLLDPVGDHALCCSKVGLYARHNDLRDEFAALCVEAGLALELEKGPDNLRPADVLVHGIDNSTGYRFFSFFSPLTFKYVIVQWQEKHVWHGNGVEPRKSTTKRHLFFFGFGTTSSRGDIPYIRCAGGGLAPGTRSIQWSVSRALGTL